MEKTSAAPSNVPSAEEQKQVKKEKNLTEPSQVNTENAENPINKIDSLLSAALAKENRTLNAALNDEQFLRRVYLDVIGRIPTYQEYKDYMKVKNRDKLIDNLFDSDGYTSNNYNYWLDALRAHGWMKHVSGQNYLNFIKKSVHENKPYDKFVHELINANGQALKEGNGPIGYYMRDQRMPLDSLSNTMQLFLSTSMVCAQCHDHPYKKWTQMDFYKLAAFNNGIYYPTQELSKEAAKEVKEYAKSIGVDRDKANIKYQTHLYDGIYNSGVGKIKLPSDYDYDDAKPGQLVEAGVPFGDEVDIDYHSSNGAPTYDFTIGKAKGKSSLKDVNSRKAFADWITSPTNPMFTKTIVNRLWNRIMGYPLAGKLLDMKSSDMGAVPELTEYLINYMKEIKYDQKKFMKTIVKTNLYQRVATIEASGKNHLFSGPVSQRLKSEKIHDSLSSLRSYDVDKKLKPAEISLHTYIFNELSKRNVKERREFSMKYMKSNESKLIPVFHKDHPQVASVYNGKEGKSALRASEMKSPSREGTFLHTYGASSREVIDDSLRDATIPQALRLMNDYKNLSLSRLAFYKDIQKAKGLENKITIIYQAVLVRTPSASELSMMKAHVEKVGKTGLDEVLWALVNSNEFKFNL